jgi:ATP-binding cassette subfamily F protein 3
LKTRIRRNEAAIEETESSLEKLNARLADETVATDYNRVLELTSEIHENNAALEKLMEEWERLQHEWEEFGDS